MTHPQPAWLKAMDETDFQFIKRFILASGSLKDLAKEYGVSYPTIRNRLDRLIGKVKAADLAAHASPLERELQIMVADGRLNPIQARRLVRAYRESLTQEKGEET